MELENSCHLDTGTYRIVDQFSLVVTILGHADFNSLVDTGLGLNHYADSERDNCLPSLLARICAWRHTVPHTVTLHLIIINLVYCFTSLFDLNRFLSVLLIVNAFLVVL